MRYKICRFIMNEQNDSLNCFFSLIDNRVFGGKHKLNFLIVSTTNKNIVQKNYLLNFDD